MTSSEKRMILKFMGMTIAKINENSAVNFALLKVLAKNNLVNVKDFQRELRLSRNRPEILKGRKALQEMIGGKLIQTQEAQVVQESDSRVAKILDMIETGEV